MAVVGRPEIVFVDEPTAGMDPQARRTTWELLEELRGDGVTVVLTTHYMDEAERLADQIHIIDHGRLIASGSPLELTRGGTAGGHDPAGGHPAVPARLPRRRCGAPSAPAPRSPSSTSSACWSPAPPTPRRWRRCRAGARRTTCCPESLTLGPAQPRGRLPPAHRTGAGAVSRDRAPSPRRPAPRRCAARCWRRPRMEARLMLRNGEQLLLAVVIPVIVLIGGVDGRRRTSTSTSPTRRSTSSPPACSRWR